VRRYLLGRITGDDSFPCLLATPQREMRKRSEPFRQDGEGFSAWMADPAADPDALVSVIVRLPDSTSVADDRVVMAKRTYPRQQSERNHPGSILSSGSGSAIKRITAGVKARRDRSLLKSDLLAGPSPSGKISFERKKNTAFDPHARLPHSKHWPV
jgi:hypothetical protein